MIKAEVIFDNTVWKKKTRNISQLFNRILKNLPNRYILKNKKTIITVLLSNNLKIKKLNKIFRRKNKPTDVLSFPIKIKDNRKLYVGDIAISYEIIKERSKGTNFFLEFDKMWIHGYLHLIGYDHKKFSDHKKMLKKEKLMLKCFHKKIDTII